ncbi:MAG: GMC family oxidoreductase [Rhodospirillales bacterium]|nr:GMC family oxidoreductase [Rhodospirillales bacterium]
MSDTDPGPDVIIIGSGPAGVSAAWPLLEAGLAVLMVDQGRTAKPDAIAAEGGSLHDLRTGDGGQWKRFLGEDFSALVPRGLVSPKLKVPGQQYVFDGFHTAYGLRTDNFHAVGSLARGGLSNVWGAGAYVYDDDDLADFPIARSDLAASAAVVARRIGLSGSRDDDMAAFYGDDMPLQPALELDARAEKLLQAYARRKPALNTDQFQLGRARNAVLSQPLGARGACGYDDMCLWGCSRGAIYNAAQELVELKKQPHFTYRSGLLVRSIEGGANSYAVVCAAADQRPVRFRSKTVVLAAGTIGSTVLALRHLRHFDRDIPLYSNPTLAVPLVLPGFLGGVLPRKNFSLGQLGFRLRTAELTDAYAHGVLFAASGLPASAFIGQIPLSRPAAIRLFRALQPALLIANCFLPGRFSRNFLKVSDPAATGGVAISGGYQPGLDKVIKSTTRAMTRHFRKLGAYAVPGGARASEPGADIHYAGTLPMRADGTGSSAAPHTSSLGELAGSPGLYVVDGAVLNQVAAKNPTFSIMANADRIARQIARRLKA